MRICVYVCAPLTKSHFSPSLVGDAHWTDRGDPEIGGTNKL